MEKLQSCESGFHYLRRIEHQRLSVFLGNNLIFNNFMEDL